MRCLLPVPADDLDRHAIHLHYADQWLDRGGLRVNFVSSADGAAHADGKSEGLQTPGDNTVFGVLRNLADVVLVGSGTALVEGYRPIQLSERRRDIRHEFGLSPALPTAIISRSLNIDPDNPLLAAAPVDARTIVLTCTAAPEERRTALQRTADVAVCGDEHVEPALVRHALVERGLTRILSEGGPVTFGQLARDAGVVDELCLSLTPMLRGPGADRMVAGAPWPVPHRLALTGALEEDGALFLRYALPPAA